jgi:hypothetical protein
MPRQIARTIFYPLSDIRKGLKTPTSADRYFKDQLKFRHDEWNNAAKRIPNSPHKSILISYITRILAAEKQRQRLTKQQQLIADAFKTHMTSERIIDRFQSMPTSFGKAIDKKVFEYDKASDADKYVSDKMTEGAESIEQAIRSSNSDTYTLESARAIIFDGIRSLIEWHEQNTTPPPPGECPSLYQLRLEYRGITTHYTEDRSGGVEPYMITGFYRIPFSTIRGAIHPLTEGSKVTQYPKNLGNMSANHWMPSGGSQDDNDNPSNPIQFFPLITEKRTIQVPGLGEMTIPVSGVVTPLDWSPVLLGRDLHCALISVWEEDGDQSAQLLSNLGAAMASIGSMLSATPIGAVIVIIGAAFELASYLTGEEDDPIGDRVLLFSESDLKMTGYTERKFRVSKGGNSWTIYIGAEAQPLKA